jgi:hypothetical protein
MLSIRRTAESDLRRTAYVRLRQCIRSATAAREKEESQLTTPALEQSFECG